MRLVIDHQAGRIGGAEGLDRNGHARIAALEILDQAHEGLAQKALPDRQFDVPGLHFAKLLDTVEQRFARRDLLLVMVVGQSTGFGQPDRTPAAFDEGDAQFGFEL